MGERPIRSILVDYNLGRICKPEIQRDYTWDSQRITLLIDSLYNGFPIGAVLFWKPDDISYFKALADQKKPKDPDEAILDGQQRITSIKKVYEKSVNVVFHVDDEKFEMENKVKKANPKWISVSELMNHPADVHQMVKKLSKELGMDYDDADDKYYIKLKKIAEIPDQKIEVIEIRDNDYDKITEIFIRLNDQGKRLKPTEIALAVAVLIFPTDFSKMLEDLNDKYGEDSWSLNSNFFMKGLAILETKQSKIEPFRKHLRTLQKTDKKKIVKTFKRLDKGISYAQDFLKSNFGINDDNNQNLVPSTNALMLLAIHLENVDSRLGKKDLEALKLWTFLAFHHGRYSGSSESTLNVDLREIGSKSSITKWIQSIKDDVGYLQATDLGSVMNRTSRFTLFYALELNNALDWRSGTSIKSNKKNEDHHIFPKKVLQNFGYENAEINDPRNIALVSEKLNRKISAMPPEKYFVDTNLVADTKRIYSQFVPKNKELWKVKNYKKFLDERGKLILKKLNEFVSDQKSKI